MDYENNNEALAIVKRMVADGQVSQDVAEKYFPELKESEDEKIRKALLEHIKGIKSWEYFLGISKEQMIAWIEKQGEPKPAWSEEDETYRNYILINCINYADKMGYVEEKGNRFLHQNAKDWLKSIKSRVQLQPKQEWNEEDEKMIEAALQFAHEYGRHGLWVWLKSIKFRLLSPSIREFDKEEGSIIDHLISICDDAMCYDTFAGCSKKDIEKYKTFLTNLKFGIDPQKKQWKPSDEQMIEL